MFFKIFLLLVTIKCITAEYVDYSDYKLYKVVPMTDSDVRVLSDIQKQNEYIFWVEGLKAGRDVRIMVAPGKKSKFEKQMLDQGFNAEIILTDVQSAIDIQKNKPSVRSTKDYAWDYYQNLDEIYEWMDQMATDYPDVVSVISIGITEEKRHIKGIVIDYKKAENPVIGVIEGGLHAREWISPATCTWIIKEFLTSKDPGVRAMAEDVVWHIFPVTNPDGYVYSFTDDRMWRKNRNPANFTSCAHHGLEDNMSIGVDLNRNFGYRWMTVGASEDPCMITFAGPYAFSEKESIAFSNHVNGLRQLGNLMYYLSYHSYSQMLLVPYSHAAGANVLEAYNYADLFEIGIKGMEKLKERYNTTYLVGTSADILYEVSGSGFDWAKGVAGIPIVFLFELRDDGRFGFLLPTEEIVPNNEETMDGMVEMDRIVRALGYYSLASSLTSSAVLIVTSFVVNVLRVM